MRTNRVCSFCGKSYYYCPTCNDKRDPMIYTRYDSAECKKAFDVLMKESSKTISTEKAKEELIKLGFSAESNVSEVEKKHFNRVINHKEEKIESVEITVNKEESQEIKEEIKEEVQEIKEENKGQEVQKVTEVQEVQEVQNEIVPRQNYYKKKNRFKNSEVINLK